MGTFQYFHRPGVSESRVELWDTRSRMFEFVLDGVRTCGTPKAKAEHIQPPSEHALFVISTERDLTPDRN